MDYKELEREWRAGQIYLSGREWISIFPDAKPRIKELIDGYLNIAEKLNNEIREDLTAIHELKNDDFSNWFAEQVIKVWKGDKLDGYIKKIKQLRVALMKPAKGEITDEMIETARNYPFEMLIDVDKSKMSHCPFHHPDTKPSFFTKGNFGYCFGCQWRGDIISFLMARDGIDFRTAVKNLQ